MISILLATYNGERFIKESIDSIINQTFVDWELLIGFNGTTDNTKEIVKQYSDYRIKTFDYGDDKGKSKTLNKLLLNCKYEWIGIQDDDDIWMENKIEEQIKHTDTFDVIGTQIKYINEHNSFIGQPSLKLNDSEIKRLSLTGDNQIANTSAIFKKSHALEINGWREGIDGIEDFDFWLKLMRNNRRFINLPIYLVNHRLHSKSNFNINKYELKQIL
jgi:glycosyltransferase involved in cell wall biosynthesis